METSIESTASPRAPAPYRPHPILGWLYRRFFAHITVDDRFRDAVNEASKRGVVVYVMRSLSFLDFLCLDFLVKQLGLPLVRFVNDLGLWILEPFGKGDRRLRLRRQIPEDQALAETIRERNSALLFLRRPPKLRERRSKNDGAAMEIDLLRTLVAEQRAQERPILLLPQTFVWSNLPERKRASFLDLFLGTREWPGKLRVLFQFVLNFRNALLRSGEPFDLKAFVTDHPALSDDELADKVRYALLRRIERERTIVLGPSKKAPYRIRDEILRAPRVRKHLEAAARATKRDIGRVEREARRELKNLCAAPDPYWIRLLHRFADGLWNRIYDGIEVDQAGLERLREAARTGPLVLVPSHKSHIDYLLLSDVMHTHALSTPLVAAGDNLSFFPLGPVLRRAGAFFIRRRFQGKKLYSALVDAYIRKILLEGFNVEFFIEGGRSRTGKLLPPKLGILSMIVDAALALRGKPIHFVPVSIGYERIVEEKSFVHELSGGEKERENLGRLLGASRVLRSKYGRLYVQFGELVTVEDVRREIAPKRPDALSPPERRAVIQRLAHRIVYDINRVTVVTPAALVATALLAHRRRGMSHDTLRAVSASLLHALRAMGARFATSLQSDDGSLREDTIDAAIRLFQSAKLIARHDGDVAIYSVEGERRMALEYYKNNVLHFFVPSALIAAALCTFADRRASEAAVSGIVRDLSRLLKFEFMFRADASFDDIFEDTLRGMAERGEIVRSGGSVSVGEGDPGARVPLYATMLHTYFEGYRLAARSFDRELGTKKEWVKRTLAYGQRMYLAGEIEMRESLSGSRLENALSAFRDLEVVTVSPDAVIARGKVSPREWIATLERMLG